MADSEVTFDVTSSEMRTRIIESLGERIDVTKNEIDSLDQQLRKAQQNLATLLDRDNEISLADLVACKDDYINSKEVDSEIQIVLQNLEETESALKSKRTLTSDLRERQREFSDELVSKMNYARRYISGNDQTTPYESLFSTKANVFSGSDETIYFAARDYALATVINHGMPLLIDSFR